MTTEFEKKWIEYGESLNGDWDDDVLSIIKEVFYAGGVAIIVSESIILDGDLNDHEVMARSMVKHVLETAGQLSVSNQDFKPVLKYDS